MTTRRRAPSAGQRRGAAVFAAVLAASASTSALPAGALTATVPDADGTLAGGGGLDAPVSSDPVGADGALTTDPLTGEVLAEPDSSIEEGLGSLVDAIDGVVDALPLPGEDAPPVDEGGGNPSPSPEPASGDGGGTGSGPVEPPASADPSTPPSAGPDQPASAATGAVPAATSPPAVHLSVASGAVSRAMEVTGPAGEVAAPAIGLPRSLAFRPDAGQAVPLGSATTTGPAASIGPRSTAPILDLLGALELTPSQLAKVLAPFPVAGRATYSDDWGQLRHGPGPRLRTHQGTDIFAAAGTPVIASTAGVVSDLRRESGLAGTSLRLTGPDGTEYFYAHLARFRDGLTEGARVSKGQVLGFVGSTGNASATSPHLHFEIHPRGGAAVPPVPFLDRWLAEALATARTLERAPDGTLSIQVDGVRRSVLSPSPSPVGNADAADQEVAGAALHRMASAASLGTEAGPWSAVLVAGALLAWLGSKLPAGRRRLRSDAAPATNEPVGGLLDLG